MWVNYIVLKKTHLAFGALHILFARFPPNYEARTTTNYDYSPPPAICICGPLEDKLVTYDIEKAI
jgi:hypothetical protein